MYALDTNTLIFFFQGKGAVAQTLLSHSPQDIAIPAVVLYELEVGIAKSTQPSRRRKQLDVLLDSVEVLAFDQKTARAAATIRSELESSGNGIGPIDVLIAATAASHRCTLVTHNLKEFSRVRGLAIEDWY